MDIEKQDLQKLPIGTKILVEGINDGEPFSFAAKVPWVTISYYLGTMALFLGIVVGIPADAN